MIDNPYDIKLVAVDMDGTFMRTDTHMMCHDLKQFYLV